MIIDGHIHLEPYATSADRVRSSLLSELKLCNTDGGAIFSYDPDLYKNIAPEKRMNDVITFCASGGNLIPFFWIDPTDEDAVSQVELAVQKGISGIKIICSGYYPSDERVLAVCRKAADLNKPVVFHSGILWDGKDSSRYNRPFEFEALIDIPKLRFSLAHVSWPWCDECIAVYGKFNNAFSMGSGATCEMFIDITPGTPRLWREEVFRKLFCGDYDVTHNIIYGTDCWANKYSSSWANEWICRDIDLFTRFGLDTALLKKKIYSENFLRFIGADDGTYIRQQSDWALQSGVRI